MGIPSRGYTKEEQEAGKKPQGNGFRPYPPEGTYPALIQDAYYQDTKSGEKIVLELSVRGPGEDRDPVDRKYSFFCDNRERGANFAAALARQGDPEALEPDDVVKRECRVVIKHEPDWKDASKIWANVSYLLPAEARAQSAPPAGSGDGRRRGPQQPVAANAGGAKTYGQQQQADNPDLPF